jgi:integrase
MRESRYGGTTDGQIETSPNNVVLACRPMESLPPGSREARYNGHAMRCLGYRAMASERGFPMKTETLPRGIRRRGSSLVAYLTKTDGAFELRTIGNVTLKCAKRQREIWQREIEENKYVKPKPRTDLILFSDICDRALEHYKNYTRCWDAAESRIARFKDWWPNRTAESIDTKEINAKLLANVAPRGLEWTETTSNEYRVTLLRIYALAIKRGELTVNPAESAERYKLENARIRELSLTEEDALLTVIRKKYPAKEVEFDLALHLGCRRSNLYGQFNAKRKPMDPLDWTDVNLDFRVITFLRSKSGKPYKVPINDTAFAAFKTLRDRCADPEHPAGAVIRKPSGIELQSSRRWFENCLTEAKVKNFHWHDLRHTFGTRLRAENVQIEDIRYLLGHGAKSITERYAHANIDVLRAAVAKLDRKTENQTDTKTDTSAVLQFRTA